MSELIRGWKRFHTRTNHVVWQEGYFDHRLRADERGDQLSAKMNYIRQNPVTAGLCAKAEDWLWVIDPFARERRGGSAPNAFGDDAKTSRQRRKIFCALGRQALLEIKFRRQSRIYFANALMTTRSILL